MNTRPERKEFLQNLADSHAVERQSGWGFRPWEVPSCILGPEGSRWGVNKVIFRLRKKPGVPVDPTCARCAHKIRQGQMVVWYRQGRFFLHPTCDAKTRRKGDAPGAVERRLESVRHMMADRAQRTLELERIVGRGKLGHGINPPEAEPQSPGTV